MRIQKPLYFLYLLLNLREKNLPKFLIIFNKCLGVSQNVLHHLDHAIYLLCINRHFWLLCLLILLLKGPIYIVIINFFLLLLNLRTHLYILHFVIVLTYHLGGLLINKIAFNGFENRRFLPIEIYKEFTLRIPHGKHNTFHSQLIIDLDYWFKVVLMKHERVEPELDEKKESILNFFLNGFVISDQFVHKNALFPSLFKLPWLKFSIPSYKTFW